MIHLETVTPTCDGKGGGFLGGRAGLPLFIPSPPVCFLLARPPSVVHHWRVAHHCRGGADSPFHFVIRRQGSLPPLLSGTAAALYKQKRESLPTSQKASHFVGGIATELPFRAADLVERWDLESWRLAPLHGKSVEPPSRVCTSDWDGITCRSWYSFTSRARYTGIFIASTASRGASSSFFLLSGLILIF